jgi:hypothetical protein
MKPPLLIVLIISILHTLIPLNSASAEDCTTACVDVYTQNGQLIFEARKGSGPNTGVVEKPKVRPKVIPKVITKPKVVAKPKVVTKPKKIAPRIKVIKKPAIKKPVAIAATSLSDRLSKSLPTGGISYQPNFQPLINAPVYFWNDIPEVFRSKVNLIGESIDVVLHPSFFWAFGDGSFLTTTDPGGAYPDGKITHIFSNPGTYPVVLITTWGGSFSHNSVERAITGQIRKTTALTITVAAAPSQFIQPNFLKR